MESLVKKEVNSSEEKLISFFLIGFSITLPLSENVNTWFLIGTGLLCLFLAVKYKLITFLQSNFILLLIPSSLFLLKLFGIGYSISMDLGIKEATRAISFLVLPFSFLVLSKLYKVKATVLVFKALVLGCLIAIIICWYNAITAVIMNNEPISNLLGWKRSNEYLTRIIDIHPPYLGFLLLTSILFLFKHYVYKKTNRLKKYLVVFVITLFIVFIFHLVARNTILTLILFFIGFLVYSKNWKYLLASLLFLVPFSFFVLNQESDYLKRKYYKMLNLNNDEIGDKRLHRLDASWEVFLNNPIIGPGIGNDDVLRQEQYKIRGYELAYQKKLNAHNQYFEYLSTFGLVGFCTFLFVLLFFIKLSLRNENYFLLALLFVFSMACITESVLERELGIKYFSLILGLILYDSKVKKIVA